MPTLKIALFGGMQILFDGRPVTLAYDKVRALLAFLLIEAQHPQRREKLAGLLWPEQSEKVARHSLSQALLKLRQAIDPQNRLIVADRHTVGLRAMAEIELDAAVFTTLLQQCQTHQHAQPNLCESCMLKRETAVALYKGPFLAGISVADAPPFEQWLTQQREQSHRQVMDALGTLTTFHEQRGEFEQAIAYAKRQLAFEPWREETHRQIMMLLARSGQRSRALKQYEQCRAILQKELNTDVSPETKTLSNQIKLRPNFSLQNLPVALMPFIGRETEIATLTRWLEDTAVRLITITGFGGMGKTRLALATAQRFLHPTDAQPIAPFVDGVYFIDLVPLSAPEQIETAVAETLHLQVTPGNDHSPRQQLIDYLSNKQMLLIFDNFEHLLAGATLVADLLQAASNLSILVTSRTQLRLRGEKVLALRSLGHQPGGFEPTAVSQIDNDAAQLFVSIAKQIVPAFSTAQDDRIQINEICRLVEGAPLAVELAAQWADTLPLTAIANELKTGIASLETDLLDLPARHRSMHAVFESSWRHLVESAKRVLARSSVFQGGFTLDAAITILGATHQTLSLLVNHSLMQFDQADRRYRCHELLRQYAATQLATDPELERQTRQKHLAYFCQLAEKGEQKLRGRDAIRWMKLLSQEKGNWQTAFGWGYENRLEMTAQMAVHLSLLWFSSGQVQLGQTLYEKLLSRQNELPDQIKGWVLTWYTAMIWVQGKLQESKQLALEACNLFQKTEDSAGIVMSYHHQSAVAFYEGELEAAISLGQKALEIARSDPNVPQWFLAVCLQGQSTCLAEVGQDEAAYRAALECLQFCEKDGNLFTGTYAMSFLARQAIRRGELAKANDLCQQGLAIAQDLNDRRMESIQYLVWGNIDLAKRDFPAAVDHLETAVAIGDMIKSVAVLDEAMMLLGDAYRGTAQYELALYIFQRWGNLCLQMNYKAKMATCLGRIANVHWQLNPGNLASVHWLATAVSWWGAAQDPNDDSPIGLWINTMQTQLTEVEFAQSWQAGLSQTLKAGLVKATSKGLFASPLTGK